MAKILRVVNTYGTLKSLQVGETVAIQHKEVAPSTIRANASSLRRTHGMDFKLCQSRKEGKTTITRTA